ncbi:MAG: methyltransferase domain-containing protein [Polyangiaceae bacterium]
MTDPWPADAVRDRLIGDVYVYQRRGGHRASTDDVITAWHACRGWARPPRRYLDLGCGIGSVLLTVAHRLRPEASLGIEAQAESVMLARRSLAELPEEAPPVALVEGDFRHHDFGAQRFDLITGSPPYFPVTAGVLPDDPQRRACRFELRGGVEAYCDVAARLLAAGGRFHLVFQSTWTERVEQAGRAAGLHLVDRCDMQSRSDRWDPFLTVYEFRHEPAPLRRSELAIRDVRGAFTPEYEQLRAELGWR